MALSDNNNAITYHCYDCGSTWYSDEVDIISSKDTTKYICKECRGRCLPKHELKKVKGIKSIKQRYRNRKIGLYILIGLILLGFYFFYDNRVTVSDYQNYLVETAQIRKSVNTHLTTFRDDYKIINDYKINKKSPDQKLLLAKNRLYKAKKYIFSKIKDVDLIEKPVKKEIVELYNLETNFWRDPSYNNYINYLGTFNNLKRKYGNDFFEVIKNTVKSQVEKTNKK